MIHQSWSRIITLSLVLFHGTNASDTSSSSSTGDTSALLPPPVDELVLPPPDILPPILSPQQQTGSLTASDIDDNLNFITYLIYARRIWNEDSNPNENPEPPGPLPFPELGEEVDFIPPPVAPPSGTGIRGLSDIIRPPLETDLSDIIRPPLETDDELNNGQQYLLPSPDLVENRLSIKVTDELNNAFSCAAVQIFSEGTNGNNVVELSAGTDGRISVFPHSSIDNLGDGPWSLVAKSPDGTSVGSIVVARADDLETEIQLQINAQSSKPNAMDLAIVLDTTGSMCDELIFLQDEFQDVITLFLQSLGRIIDLRIAVVFYKDEGDDYVVSATDFTDVDSALSELQSGVCKGGGDYPEAVHSAWEEASELDWKGSTENVARVAFLIGDAPPHREHIQSSFDAALRLRANGVRLYGLAASDTNDLLEYLLRMVALLSHGRHMWLTNDSGIGNSKADAKVACFQVTELEKLLTRVLLGEMEGERIEPDSEEDIIREFGAQEAGICIIDMNDPEASLKPSRNDFTSVGTGRPSGGALADHGGTEDAVAFIPSPDMPSIPGSDVEGGDGGGGGDDDLVTGGDDDNFFDSGDSGGGDDGGGNATISICFPGDSVVYVHQKGPVLMKDLKLGDEVLVKEGSDRDSFSPVYSFGHYNPDVEAEYIKIDYKYVEKGGGEIDDAIIQSNDKYHQLKISKDHMVFVMENSEGSQKRRAIPASLVTPGDRLILSTPKRSLIPIVTKTSVTTGVGAFAPFTHTGTISVNGVLASNYVSLLNKNSTTNALSMHEQFFAHSFQAPHRIACHISWSFCKKTETYNSDGISHWVSTPLVIFQWLFRQRWLLQTMLVPVIFGIAIFLTIMEFLLLHWLFFSMTTVVILAYRKSFFATSK